MRISKTNQSPVKVTLQIIASTDELAAIKNSVLESLAKTSAKLPGFRAGKAPLALVEKNLDPNLLQNEFLDSAVNQLYTAAVQDQKLRPVASPQVSITKFVPFTTLEIAAEVEIIGSVTLPDYKKIKKTKPSVTVTVKDVADVLTGLQKRQADKTEVKRAAKTGDEVVIDFAGSDAATKQPVSGADGKDYPLVLGSATFIPGFEDHLLGLSAGQSKTFVLTFPKDYQVSALRGKKVSFAVTVKKVQELKLSKVDDGFAAKAGPFKTLAELKADIKKQLTAERQQQSDREFENELVDEITKASKLDVPQALIEEQTEQLERNTRQNLAYRGQTWPEFLESEGTTEEKYRAEVLAPQAEQRVRAGLVLAEIAEREQLTVTPQEFDARLQQLKTQYVSDEQMLAELAKPENQRDVASRLLTEKTLACLTGYALAK